MSVSLFYSFEKSTVFFCSKQKKKSVLKMITNILYFKFLLKCNGNNVGKNGISKTHVNPWYFR